MSVIAEFSVPATEFVLGRALDATTGLSIELEKVIPAGGAMIPYFWVIGEERGRFDDVLAAEPEIEAFSVVDELEDRALYRVEWNESADPILRFVDEYDVVIQEAGGDADAWEFQIRFPDSHVLSEFHTACREADLDIDVRRLYNPIEITSSEYVNLTEAQRSLLIQAHDEGYFEVPRKTTLVELSDEVGISDQAVNERMRRGLDALIASTLKSGTTELDT